MIILDTNLLPRGGAPDSLEMNVLAALARETGQQLALPSLTLEEAVSVRRREIEGAFDALLAAHRAARKFANLPALPEFPLPGELAREYESQLRSRFQVIDLPDAAAFEALRREAHRLRPAREGQGARDVAIWLTVRSAHAGDEADTYFLSGNTKDFAAPGGELHPELRDEVARLPGSFHYARSVAELLALVADEEDDFVTVDFLKATPEADAAVVSELLRAATLGKLTAGRTGKAIIDPLWILSAGLTVEPTEVREVQTFRVEDRRVAVAWTRWEASLRINTSTHTPGGSELEEHPCEASLQLLVRIADDDVDVETLTVGMFRTI